MKNEKIYIEGYVVGFLSGTDGTREKKIQVISGEIVNIDENFIYKSIEPQKVTIPQFVADWIEECEEKEKTLLNSLLYTPEGVNSWVGNSDNQETFARAWLDGYEVEEEKRYLVKMKGIDTDFNYLNRHRNENYWIFSSKDKNTLYQTHHTRKELEENGFSWVFDCEGIEVEEVVE